ncbi:DNA topoisomerase subunit B [Mycoplasma tauri]|uniref:DNA topoisomerase subunit B n=1 Tax=Mycoplasma tauri TaxID=547987 RepID=UPI0019682796|nr:DNA topoisomerase subunit B [Mycoplasma tauri]MBZ4203426.1 type IIA DNA topoisomerase subunit B [Mycoplasma tauri]MBZ4204025.1 type IIA DNA topoisomerase subunit B [Mycoplasma tauri]QSB07498.1 type IIA DNA topoisomerase subunit B [Mycoplasma tauri]
MEESKNQNKNIEPKSNDYDASNIRVLEGLEAVRVRPGMYIGTITDKGLHHLVWEIVDNSVDECMAGFADSIKITICKDGYIEVQDNGRGIPVDKHPQTGLSTVETVLTVLHAGGKFDSGAYKVSGGLHGVGASVVNALSEDLHVWVKRDGHEHYAHFEKGGQTVQPLTIINDVPKNETGTKIKFYPDFTILEKHPFSVEAIEDHAKRVAYLTKGTKLTVVDEINETTSEFYYEGGLVDYINELNEGQRVIHPQIVYAEGSYDSEKSGTKISVEVALQYTANFQPRITTYTNNIVTIEGGTHDQGFYDALVRIINTYAFKNNLIKNENDKLNKEDISKGLVAIVSVKHPNPIFEGQTKGKLNNKDARAAVREILAPVLERYFNENPVDAKEIINKCLQSRKSRLAAEAAAKAVQANSSVDGVANLPGKLANCTSKNAEICELYIVEGNSAGGSAKMGRDRNTQAILPLRGKVINSEKSVPEKVLSNAEIISLITALGTGLNESFNINKLRYHKIIIMTDADVDGAHIRTLLLTFFYRYFKPLIEYGFVYIAQPPLYKIQQNKFVGYAYNDAQKDEIMSSLNPNAKVLVQRYKGLGEMDPEQLWETTMDPANRKMYQVQINDAAKADWAFTTLMGDDVLPRREFIEKNAKYVKNIDI